MVYISYNIQYFHQLLKDMMIIDLPYYANIIKIYFPLNHPQLCNLTLLANNPYDDKKNKQTYLQKISDFV